MASPAASAGLPAALQALRTICERVAQPPAAPRPPCRTKCCSGRFEDPALLQQAADAVRVLASPSDPLKCSGALAGAVAGDAAVRQQALELASDVLPKALMHNLEPFFDIMKEEVHYYEIPLPQALFFDLLQAQFLLVLSLWQTRGPAAMRERMRVLRALVPVLHGVLDATGCGYGYMFLLKSDKVGRTPGRRFIGTWEEVGGSYDLFFFAQEVTDEGVLRAIREHDMADYYKSASDVWQGHATDWVQRL